MKDITFSRRVALLGAAALPWIRAVKGQAKPKSVVISSANRNNGGVNCCAKAMEIIKGGGDTLDAVIAGVNIVELDPRDNSVGYGGLPNEDGVVELDASCMHGPSRRGGAVGALRNIKTPSKVAQKVLAETDHMMLVGEGALRFAKAAGFKEEDLLTEESRIQWLVWKRQMRDKNGHTNWESGIDAPPAAKKIGELKRLFPQADEALLEEALRNAANPPHGTINCIALNEKGEMSAVTTTSGLAWKIPGRCGDSPIIGGGLWLDQDVGGAGSTGRGEENLRVCGAHTVVENMRLGMSPKEAALDALKRVARNFDNDEKRLQAVDLNFYALRKDGEYAGASLWGTRNGRGPQFAVSTGDRESHHENCVYLFERK
ncbi:Glycosylasparaginase. Threonine peptidase. MEROPS family T02 [Candidatus Sulfopaludibacter sp. SbA4]|nr:Glycosylasparaginase. Threonine peptidase. MEROPS family T02 [Candidatus Sulfopaludibacter sp. SbA4]